MRAEGKRPHETQQAQPSRLRFRWPLVVGLLIASAAFAQLTTFQPDAPALASQVNGNFNQLKLWLEQKVGAVGTANVTTTGSLTAGSVSATSLAVATTLTAGAVTATSIASSTIVSGTVRGGFTSRCTANSATQIACTPPWGSGACGTTCGGGTCSRGTKQLISSAFCYDASQTALCYDYLCVE